MRWDACDNATSCTDGWPEYDFSCADDVLELEDNSGREVWHLANSFSAYRYGVNMISEHHKGEIHFAFG